MSRTHARVVGYASRADAQLVGYASRADAQLVGYASRADPPRGHLWRPTIHDLISINKD